MSPVPSVAGLGYLRWRAPLALAVVGAVIAGVSGGAQLLAGGLPVVALAAALAVGAEARARQGAAIERAIAACEAASEREGA